MGRFAEEKGKSHLLARKFDFSVDKPIVLKVLKELCGLNIEP